MREKLSSSSDQISSIAAARERLARHSSSTLSSSRTKKRKRPSTPEELQDAAIIQCLAKQAYHLPTNHSWGQDLRQYLCNNHLLLGICCHHPLHPLDWKIRILALAGSLLVGAFLTNLAYLLWIEFPAWGTPTILSVTIQGTEHVVTTGMVLLWTVGGAAHTAWDLLLWKLAACACCLPGGCLYYSVCCHCCSNLWGQHMMRALIAILLLLTALVVLLRVSISTLEEAELDEQDELDQGLSSLTGDLGDIAQAGSEAGQSAVQDHKRQEFHFLAVWLLEQVLAMLIYYPIAAIILFSGLMGCIPGLGGWPAEIRAEQQKKRSSKRQFNLDGDEPAEQGQEVLYQGA